MVDLGGEMGGLWASLGASSSAGSRVIQFVAAHQGEGTSLVARELCRFVAQRAGKTVWLIDLDLQDSPQTAAIAGDPALYGGLGKPTHASPDGLSFVTVQPPLRQADGEWIPDGRYVVAYPVGEARWWVTRFRQESLRGAQRAQVLPGIDYWAALRRHADLIVIDSPSADRSRTALTLAPYVDETVLVVAADQPDIRGATQLKDAITRSGGLCSGLFYNRARSAPPVFSGRGKAT